MKFQSAIAVLGVVSIWCALLAWTLSGDSRPAPSPALQAQEDAAAGAAAASGTPSLRTSTGQVTSTAAAASPTLALAPKREPEPRTKENWHCRFTSFTKGYGELIIASAGSAVYASETVFVMERDGHRVLVSRTRYPSSSALYCFEQADVKCVAWDPVAGPPVARPGSVPDKVGEERQRMLLACGGRPACVPEIPPGFSYAQSMLGGAMQAIGGPARARKVAVIGLGAGAMVSWLHRHLPTLAIDAVELSGEVIAAAPCFGLQADGLMKFVQAEGRKYLEGQHQSSLDIIFLDAFDSHSDVPACLQTVEFFQMARTKLSLGGVLVVNVWARELAAVFAAVLEGFYGVADTRANARGPMLGRIPGFGNGIILATASSSARLAEDAPPPPTPFTPGTAQTIERWAAAAHFVHWSMDGRVKRLPPDLQKGPARRDLDARCETIPVGGGRRE